MSHKRNNVNPDHYKTAGREPQGQAIIQEIQKQRLTENVSIEKRAAAKRAPAAKRIQSPGPRKG